MIYLANDSIHYQTVFIPRQSYQSGTTRNPDYGSGLTSGDVINLITQSDAFERVVYDPTTKRIYFYNGEGTPATTSVDCTDFIKDGMVSEVKIENGYLIIVFNTDSGKENISIPLTDIFNPDNYYTKTETDTKLGEKQNNLVSGQNIKTINNESIIGSGNIDIKGTEYEAGENIDITGRVISVTGITIPTKTSELINDSDFVDSSTVESAITEAISGIPSEFKTVNGETITGEGNIEIAVPTKTSELINDSGFLTEHQSLSAYSTTEQMNSAISSATQDMATTGDLSTLKSEIEAEIPTKTSELTNDSGFLTEHQSLSAYSTTVEVEGMINTATQDMATTGDLNTLKTEIESEIPDVSNFVTSGEVEERVEGFEETTSRALNDLNIRVNSKQDTLVSGTNIKTINNESIIGSGNIEISAGTEYEAGTNIDITNNTISVTGITIPDVSQFITSGQAQSQIDSAITAETARTESTYLKEHQSLSAYSTTEQVQSMINSAKTEVEAEIPTKVSDLTNDAGYLTQHQSLNGLFASVNYVSSAKTIYFYDKSNTQVGSVDATDFIKDGMVDNVYISGGSLCISFNTDSGKETITIPLTDIFNPNNYYDKTAIDNIIASETARTESTYLKEHQSLSAYSTTVQVQGMINSAKTEVEAEIPTKVSDLTNDAGYLTQHQSLSAYSTTEQVQGMINSAKTEVEAEIPTKTSELTNDSGFLTEHQSLSAYSTTQEMNTAISNATSGKQDTLVSGTNIKTVNNQSILGAGNIEISGGTTYSAGTNIDITNNTISVTGITIPDVSQFITSGQAQSQIDSALQEYDAFLPSELSSLGFIKNDVTTDVNIINIRVLTQSAYDNLVSTSSVSETTIYIIKN